MQGELVIEMKNVAFRQSSMQEPIVLDVNLTVRRGEWVCIAGRNGSGKSTLVRLMNGLLPATEGSIRIEGIPLEGNTRWDALRRIGIVFANPEDQFVGLTVLDDIAFGLENLGLRREEMQARIDRVAEQLDLGPLLDRHPSTLSGGQQQRAAIAAVLAMEPSIVIFDEAGSMLDERSRRELLRMMKSARQQREYTMLSVTHDVEEMLEADRLIVMDGGRIIADGPPGLLLGSSKLLETCRLVLPFPLQLCKALQARGVDIGNYATEREVLDALCALHSQT